MEADQLRVDQTRAREWQVADKRLGGVDVRRLQDEDGAGTPRAIGREEVPVRTELPQPCGFRGNAPRELRRLGAGLRATNC